MKKAMLISIYVLVFVFVAMLILLKLIDSWYINLDKTESTTTNSNTQNYKIDYDIGNDNSNISGGGGFNKPSPGSGIPLHKPVIYYYPEYAMDINTKIDYDWELIVTYPSYDHNNWRNIRANTDGTLINKADNMEYSYLFWEWIDNHPTNYDMNQWFVVKWSDTVEFLQKILSNIWLTPKEYNEFIVYWYPKMMNNKYNWIYFAGSEYTQKAKLNIDPKPDSILRVFMVYQALDNPIQTQEQVFDKFIRKWFTVVEWWWSEIPKQ